MRVLRGRDRVGRRVSLLLPASSYLTGAVIPVDGGMMAQNT